MRRPRSGLQPPQTCVVGLGPLRLDQVDERPARATDLADPVAEGAVVLDVERPRPRSSTSTYGVRSKYERRRPSAPPAPGRREGPAHRVGHREDPAPAGSQHPGHLTHDRGGVGDERHRAVRREGQVERSRRRTAAAAASAWTQRRRRRRCAGVDPPGVRRADRPERSSATTCAPWPTSQRRTARRRSRPRAPGARPTVAEQVGVGLAQPLRAPDEVGVAEEVAVLGLVVGGGGVPPARSARAVSPRRPVAAAPPSAVVPAVMAD